MLYACIVTAVRNLCFHLTFSLLCGAVPPYDDLFPQPYPSQYDAAAGRSGFAAGAYMYGAPAKQAVSLYRQSEQPQIVLDW